MNKPATLPRKVWIETPYRSQLDNRNNPHGSCNVTAITMALLRFGKRSKHPGVQLEDELYEYMEDNRLDRHAPEDLAKVVQTYGCKDVFTYNGNLDMARQALANGEILVIHGYFTRWGHIITGVGYDDDQQVLEVHDPNGEYFAGGYDTRANGAYLRYSYNLIQRVAMPDGKLWLHRISA